MSRSETSKLLPEYLYATPMRFAYYCTFIPFAMVVMSKPLSLPITVDFCGGGWAAGTIGSGCLGFGSAFGVVSASVWFDLLSKFFCIFSVANFLASSLAISSSLATFGGSTFGWAGIFASFLGTTVGLSAGRNTGELESGGGEFSSLALFKSSGGAGAMFGLVGGVRSGGRGSTFSGSGFPWECCAASSTPGSCSWNPSLSRFKLSADSFEPSTVVLGWILVPFFISWFFDNSPWTKKMQLIYVSVCIACFHLE